MKQFDEFLKDQESLDIAQQHAGAYPRNYMGDPEEKSFQKDNSYVVQKYIQDPALLHGHKFDFRIYVLITSVIDLTIFLYEDGLVRLASQPYNQGQDIGDSYAHLTNYSLNKKNDAFDGEKHKLRLSDVLRSGLSSSSDKGIFVKNREQIFKEI